MEEEEESLTVRFFVNSFCGFTRQQKEKSFERIKKSVRAVDNFNKNETKWKMKRHHPCNRIPLFFRIRLTIFFSFTALPFFVFLDKWLLNPLAS